jgi:SAM-dependent methyltransferase
LITNQAELLSKSWDEHAQEWIDWVRAPGRHDSYWRFHRDWFLSLVPSPGELTLDIGCGEGRVGRDLRELKHKVLGIDLSHTMCRAAATHPDEPSPAVCADAVQLPLADESADCAIAFMSLQDIDDMPAVVDEIARVLHDDRPLVLAIVHPMYSGGGFNDGDVNSSRSFVIKRPYLQRERLRSTDVHGSLQVTFFREHRPLQVYTQALIKAGFNIEDLLELTDEDPSRNRNGIPLFLDIVARRRPRDKPADSELRAFERDYGDDTKYPPYQWLRHASLQRILAAASAISPHRA